MKRKNPLFLFAMVFAGGLSVLFLSSSFINVALALPSPSVTPTSQTSINLSWSDPYGAYWFNIYRCSGASCTPTYYTQVYSTSYNNSGLTCGTTYGYYVTSDYGSSATVYGTTDACTPGVPTIGTNTAASQLAFTTTWTRNAPLNESGFEVNSSLTPFPANTSAGATSYTGNWAAACNTTGNNSVRSFVTTNGRTYYSGMSAASNNATTDACTPAAPTMTSAATVNQSQVIVYFTDNSTNETGFEIMKSGGSQVGSSGAIGGTGSPTSGYATDLSCNVSDYYYVNAYVNTNGRTYRSSSAWSNYVATDQCTPGAATIGTATAVNQTTASVTWTRGSPYTETAFDIWDQGPTFRGSATAGSTSGNATGLTCNTSYMFRVVPYVTGVSGATYSPGQSGQTNSITTGPCTPGDPSGPSATANSCSQITVAWSAGSGSPTGYSIERSPNGSTGWSVVGTPAGTSYPDTSVSASTIYYYRVRSYVNGTGGPYYSGYTSTVNATTPSCNTAPTASPTNNGPVNENQAILFSANATDAEANISSYQWYSDVSCSTAVGGQTGSTMSITNTEPTSATYYVKVTDTGGLYVCSAGTTGTWNNLAPSATGNNGSGTETSSVSVSMSPSDPGGGALTYKWFTGANCSGEIAGAVSATYNAGVQNDPTSITYYGRAYDAQLWGSDCNTGAATASWTNLPPTGSVSPGANPINENSSVTFTASFSDPGGGGTPLAYQWYTDSGCTSPVGTNSTTYSDTPTEPGTFNRYVKVTDVSNATYGNGVSACTGASPAVTVNNLQPSVAPTNDGTKTDGATSNFTANASDPGGSSFTYQWYSDGTCSSSIGGAINSTLAATCSYPSVTRSVKAWDAQSLASACGASTATCTDITPPTPNPPTVSGSALSCTSIRWTISTGSDSQTSLNASPYGFSTTAGGTYTWQAGTTWDETGLTGSTAYTRYGKIRDNAGTPNLTSAGSGSLSTPSCNTAPNVPTPTSPANNSWVNSRQFCATVTDPDGGNVTAKFVIGGTTYSGSTVTSGSQSCYTHLSDTPVGGTTWYAYAQDPATAVSANTATITAKIDTDTTGLICGSTWTPSSGPWHNTLTGTSFTLTGSSDNLSGISTASYNCTTGPNNTNTCNATIGDNAGNTASCGPSPANNVDQINPSTGTLTANPSGWTTSASVAITGTVTDAGGSGPTGYYYKCTSGGSYVYAAGSSISFSCSTTGGQTAYVYGLDGATNTNSASPSSVSYYIDPTPPTAGITGNSVNENSAMTLNSNGADTGGSNVASYAWYSGILCSGTVLGSSATYAAGTQTEPYSANYAVKVTDGAGSTVCATATATWNNVAPTASASVIANPSCHGDSITWSVSPSDPGGTTFSYQWYSDGTCSSSIGGAVNSTLGVTAVYPSVVRSVIVKDAQNLAATCAPATATVNSCAVAPNTPTSGTTAPDPGRPRTTLSWSSNAGSYQIWRFLTGAASSTRSLFIDTTNTSATIGSLICPAGYTFEVVAYNTDVSVSGTDSSCALWGISGSKCAFSSIINTKIDFCTKLFLGQ